MSRRFWKGWGNSMAGQILLDPLLPWPLAATLAAGIASVLAFAARRGLNGWALRGLAAAAMLVALANPSLQWEEREPLEDIVLMAIDRSASQDIGGRREQTGEAERHLRTAVAARRDTELREIVVGDGSDDRGTLLMTEVSEALAGIPADRLAGVLLVTDGLAHDPGRAPAPSAPMHILLTGRSDDWDRRVSVPHAPPFAILDEPVTLTVRIDDLGAAPATDGFVELEVATDDGTSRVFRVPVGRPMNLSLTLPHGGMNTFRFSTPRVQGELTGRNNAAVARISGVRDRLKVLLVSGEPHPGGRTWRNLLKSDSSVDLVHFTILRPPDKQDGVPVNEQSLIAFPTRELFLEKVGEFDLIVFDRYRRRGLLPDSYLGNVADYVNGGGAALFVAGPDFASANSLYHSDLARVIPARPTARVIERGFRPRVSDLGARHPVTADLHDHAPDIPARENGEPGWGRWLRQVELTADRSGQTVMTGADENPLLILARFGEGRVALIGSDHGWLWARGFEGGGPQSELLRRLAHWTMKEPELEEEALWAETHGRLMTVVRRSLARTVPDMTVIAPDGSRHTLSPVEVSPGRFEAVHEGGEAGLYRLSSGGMTTVAALGPAAPREFVDTISDASALLPAVQASGGGVIRLEDGLPALRDTRVGRPTAGRGWIGLTPREAYLTADVKIQPAPPAWAFLLLAGSLLLWAWLREGRRRDGATRANTSPIRMSSGPV